MNGLTLSPALGWPIGGGIAVVMVLFAIVGIVQHIRRRSNTDETLVTSIRRAIICLLLAAMALTPSIVSATDNRAINATNVVIAVDVTGSMAVDDAAYGDSGTITRLQAAKLAIADLTDSYPNASFAGLSFGSNASLDVPLTPDTGAIENWANSLSTEPTSQSAGSSLDTVLDRALVTLKSIQDEHPDDVTLFYVITDGEQTSATNRRTFSSLRSYVTNAFALGVGSAQGGKIPLNGDGSSTSTDQQWVTDPSTGEPGISVMDEATLEAIADEMGGSFVALNADHTVSNSALASMSSTWNVTQTVKHRERISPVIWPLTIALVILLIWELATWIFTSRRLL